MNTKIVLVAAAVLVVLGAGFMFLGGKTSSTPSVPSAPATKEFTLNVVGKKLTEGTNTLSVKEGDTVTLHITCDEAEELHLHGYDRSVDLEPNTLETLTFVANVTGRFPFELEKSKTELGVVEVYP